jgi:hypothetical protein
MLIHKTTPPDWESLTHEQCGWVQAYVDECERIGSECSVSEVEAKVVITDESWGTVDYAAVHIEKKIAYVVDFKSGVMPVSPAADQMKAYGAGVTEKYDFLEIETVHLIIVQPRVYDEPQVYRASSDELRQFKKSLLKLTDRVNHPRPDFKTGDHCRFCRAAAICTVAFEEAAAPLALDPEDVAITNLGAVMDKIDHMKRFIKAVEQRVRSDLTTGATVSGYKLVKGRGRRSWNVGVDDIEGLLSGIFESEAYEKKWISVAQAEKKLGRRVFEESELAECVSSSDGAPTVATVSDPRPTLVDEEAFEDIGEIE